MVHLALFACGAVIFSGSAGKGLHILGGQIGKHDDAAAYHKGGLRNQDDAFAKSNRTASTHPKGVYPVVSRCGYVGDTANRRAIRAQDSCADEPVRLWRL